MSIFRQLEADFQAGIRGHILTGNIYDYVLCENRPPAPLPSALCDWLGKHGYLVVWASRAGGLRLVDTGDPRRLQDALPWFQRQSGLRPRTEAGLSPGEPLALAELRDILFGSSRLLRQRERPVALFFDYPQHFVPATQGMAALASPEQQLALEYLHRWGRDEQIRATRNRILLLAPDGSLLHELLLEASSGYRVLRLGLPASDERRQFLDLLRTLHERGRTEFARLEADLSSEQAAALSAGLRLLDLESLARAAAAQGGVVSRTAIRDLKARLIAQLCGDLLEVLPPLYGLTEITGLPHAVAYLSELSFRLKAGCPDAPRAILLMGVPGCGKTFVAGALAKDLDWNCLAMRNVLSKWVGESERNLEKVFAVTDAMTPCEFFIDEIDQALAQRGEGGDAGTSRRMLKRTMEFLAEERHRGNVLFVAATNAPHLLDPAIDDRFGVKIPFLHPTCAERMALLPILAQQLGRRLAEEVDLQAVATLPSLQAVTVRDLLEILGRAAQWTDVDKKPGEPLDQAYLAGAARAHHRNYNPLQHEYIALIAIRKTSAKDLYPWMQRRGTEVVRRPEAEIPGYLRGIVDERTGEVDDEALERRLQEVARALQLDAALRRF